MTTSPTPSSLTGTYQVINICQINKNQLQALYLFPFGSGNELKAIMIFLPSLQYIMR